MDVKCLCVECWMIWNPTLQTPTLEDNKRKETGEFMDEYLYLAFKISPCSEHP